MKSQKLTDADIKKLIEKRAQTRDVHLEIHALHKRLQELGAMRYNLALPETHNLPLVLHHNERIRGIVYGRYRQDDSNVVGRGVLVITDKRILLLDKKPLYLRCDELTHDSISGVSYSKAGPAGTVTLHTRFGNVKVRTFNTKCALSFVEAVETTIYADPSRPPDLDLALKPKA